MLFQSSPVCVQHKPLRNAFNNVQETADKHAKQARGRGQLKNYLQQFYNFCICLSLLSTNLVYLVNSNPISSNTQVSNKAFAVKLSNPCTLRNGSRLEGDGSQQIPSSAILRWMKDEIPNLKQIIEAILRENDLGDIGCTASSFGNHEEIPLAENFLNNATVEVVRLFYTSLVNHTAYVFFISEQIQKNSASCSWDATLNREWQSKSLESKMQVLMCRFRSFAITLPSSTNDLLKDAHKQIFNEEFTDTSRCSATIFNACRTLQNTLKILTEMLSYLRTIRSSR